MPLENMDQSKLSKSESATKSIPWTEIVGSLENLRPADGGYSDARRGFITMENGRHIFVKVGVNEHTKGWASKEIKSYDFLAENSYPYIPELLSRNEDETGFALEALLSEDGWDWSDKWSDERLTATLAATDALAAIKPSSNYAELFKPVLTDESNGWLKLLASKEAQSSLRIKLKASNEINLINEINTHAEKSSHYRISHDALVHDDVRADNCAWNETSGQVKLVDWNWLELGDRKIDLAAMLVHIQNSGFDILPKFADRLDADALHWIAGFWLESASKPIWPGGPEKLRTMQLDSGITALRLSREIS